MNSTIVLVCAVLASLAAGVLLAHGICVGMFRIFRLHSRQVQAERTARASVQTMGSGAFEASKS